MGERGREIREETQKGQTTAADSNKGETGRENET